jgi:putative heme-binding domain-containing protein
MRRAKLGIMTGLAATLLLAGHALAADEAKPSKPTDSKSGTPRAPATIANLVKLEPPKWLWDKASTDGKVSERVWFRKEFMQRGGIPSARVYLACDNEATLWIDGVEVVTHSGWGEAASKDVTEIFNKEVPGDRHVFAVEGKNVGNDNPAGIFVSVVFESGWRDAWAIVSDDSWITTTTKPAEGWQKVDFKAEGWAKAAIVAKAGGDPWKLPVEKFYAAAGLKAPTATPIADLKIAKGFEVDLLYSVPKDKQGSWVNLCIDPKGRLIVSDQYGGLYRVALAKELKGAPTIEKIPVDLGEAQGLLWAFDSLYVVVNKGQKYDSGLYRVTDTNGDDTLDKIEKLKDMEGVGEHGPHAVLLTPDGKDLFVVCGNSTKPIDVETSRVPVLYDEDQLMPRIYGRGFMKGVPPPAGCIYKVDRDGKHWKRVTSGFRNQFDAALNADGELFTYDADMEWDFNTPWYRPTRVCHVVSGVDYGWRNGSAKWPVHYADTVPPVVNVGPGSPTGVCFGYGAKFPAKYQNALYLCDWSYGKLYAAHLSPKGSSYEATLEEFVTGTPLPLTDVVIHPDGAMYFAIGGRKVQSGLYRVRYTGPESTAPAVAKSSGAEARAARRKLESFHEKADPAAIDAAWPQLRSTDRFLRTAARTAIEHQPADHWQDRALAETDPQASLAALLALVRTIPRTYKPTGPELDTPTPAFPAEKPEHHPLQAKFLAALDRFDWNTLSYEQRSEFLRVTTLVLYRLGTPDEPTRARLIARLDPLCPAKGREHNVMLVEMLCWLQAPSAATKGVALLSQARTQEEQIDFARSLRFLTAGWTTDTRRAYMEWFIKGLSYKGGANFAQFMQELKNDAVARLPEADRKALDDIINAPIPAQVNPIAVKPRPVVKEWKMDELTVLLDSKLKQRDFDKGREMFAAANCFGCHRFSDEGGATGPDLTILAGRFSRRDILESVLEPSKTISDQYAAVQVVTQDGRTVVGRIVNLAGDVVQINTNMLDPNALASIDRKQIEEMLPSKISMMPVGLLNTLKEDEILDLMAFLLSRGDRNSPFFK